MCDLCQAEERTYWGPTLSQPKLETVEDGNWISLQRCPQCGVLWVYSPYEPYAAFPYLAHWPWTQEKWSAVHAADSGTTLHAWHKLAIRSKYASSPRDIGDIEAHRRRSYGFHNPIDYSVEPSLNDILAIIESTQPKVGS